MDEAPKINSFKHLLPENPAPIHEEMQQAIRQAVVREQRRRLKVVEEYCEKMLTSGEDKGVLIIENFASFEFKVLLSDRVPFGQIHIMKDEELYDRLVSPPAEGGGGS